jgi:hypothetical protein
MTNYIISQELLNKITFRIRDEVLSSHSNELEVRNSYSGRGMYDNICIGFVTDASIPYLCMGIGAILADMYEADELVDVDGDMFEWFDLKTATDSMGFSTIVYFPNLSVEATSKEYRDWIAE